MLDITVAGWGSKITIFKLDGKSVAEAKIPGTITGRHSIYIEMDGKTPGNNSINLRNNEFSLATPTVVRNGNLLQWNKIKDATGYDIYENAKHIVTTSDTAYHLKSEKGLCEYQVQCISKDISPSFLSNPVQVYQAATKLHIETDKDIPDRRFVKADGYSGKGYTVLEIPDNEDLKISASIEHEGNYLVSFRFSNGNGDFTTDYNCAIRSLYVNGKPVSVVVFPQMEAKNNWSYWSFTAPVKVHLIKGLNAIALKYDPWNENMSGVSNKAYIDFVKLIRSR